MVGFYQWGFWSFYGLPAVQFDAWLEISGGWICCFGVTKDVLIRHLTHLPSVDYILVGFSLEILIFLTKEVFVSGVAPEMSCCWVYKRYLLFTRVVISSSVFIKGQYLGTRRAVAITVAYHCIATQTLLPAKRGFVAVDHVPHRPSTPKIFHPLSFLKPTCDALLPGLGPELRLGKY